MKIYPKEEIKNIFGQTIYHFGKEYKCERVEPNSDEDDPLYVIYCELIGNEYPMIELSIIKRNFYTEDELRDSKIKKILK